MAPFHSSMYILTFVVFCQIGLSFQDYDCEAKFDDAEKCFQQLMIVGKNIKFTKESFQALCTTEFDAIGCIQEYKTHCVKGMASMVFNLLAKKFNATFNNLCKNEDAMEEFLEHYNCLKDSLMSDRAKLCSEQYHLRLEMIDEVTKEERFPIICCGFYEIKACISKELHAGCNNEASIEYMNTMVTKFVSGVWPCVCEDLPNTPTLLQVGDLNKMFCSDWKSLDMCRTNLPPTLAERFQKINAMDLPTVESTKKIKSFLRLLKHLIEVAGH